MEITYHWEGDYLIPDFKLSDTTEYQIGKYGRMRQRFLKENHGGIYLLLEFLGIFTVRCENQIEPLVEIGFTAVGSYLAGNFYFSDFEKIPHKENIIPVISKTEPIIITGSNLKLNMVCQYLPNWVFHSVVFSKLILAIKDGNSNINAPVISNPIPAIIFFMLILQ